MRKDAGLDISDRIHVVYQAQGEVAAALANFADYIRQETLALTLNAADLQDPLVLLTVEIGDENVTLALRKA
jgi:isoleucyl-tRNA synthetase